MNSTVGIFGVGTIGGSIGMRVRRNGGRVIGADSNEGALDEAAARGAIDAISAAANVSERCDVYVIAAHLEGTLQEIDRLRRLSETKPSLILDVASVKQPVVHAAFGLANFVATHPMAGSERSGVQAARADLFDGHTWAYVPSGNDGLDERAREFIESMGAIPFAISAEDHDRAVALTSHVPQIIAWYFASLVRSSDGNAERLCGPVANELLRISRMSFAMWGDLLQANAANIAPQLRTLGAKLEAAADQLSRNEFVKPM